MVYNHCLVFLIKLRWPKDKSLYDDNSDPQIEVQIRVRLRLRVFRSEHAHFRRFQPPDFLRVLSMKNVYSWWQSYSDLQVAIDRDDGDDNDDDNDDDNNDDGEDDDDDNDDNIDNDDDGYDDRGLSEQS